MAYEPKIWVNDESELSAENFNPMEQGIAGAYPVQLIAISDTAPSQCVENDKYYNTSTKKVYTATGTNTWGTNGETPLEDTAYWLISENGSYAWNGTDLVSIGGGKAEVVISDEEPEEGKLWVNPEEEIPVIAGREHLVQVSNEVDEDYRVNVLKSNNLFDYQNTSQILIGVNINTDTNKLVSDSSCTMAYCPCKPNTTYTISRRSPMANRFVIATSSSKPKIGTDLLSKQLIFDDTTTSYTLTTNANANYIIIRFINNVSSNDYYTYAQTIQIEEGNEATTYEAFVPNEINVNGTKYTDTINVGLGVDSRSRVNVLHSKNLFDGKLELGNFNNTTGTKIDASNLYRNVNKIPVKPNTTYTFSIDGVSQKYCLFYYTNAQTFISYDFNLTTGTFTTPANCYFLNFRCFGGDYTDNYANLDVQLEEGSTATSYEPYITPSINVDGEEIYSKPVIYPKRTYYYKGLSIDAQRIGNTCTINVGGALNETLNSDTFYDLTLDTELASIFEISMNFLTRNGKSGMLRITTANKLRIYPYASLGSGEALREIITYLGSTD